MISTTITTCRTCGDDVQYSEDELYYLNIDVRTMGTLQEALAKQAAYYEGYRERNALQIAAGNHDQYMIDLVAKYDGWSQEERERYAIRNFLVASWASEEIAVCSEHIGICDWCQDTYYYPTRDESDGTYVASQPGSRSLATWAHSDLCQSCSDDASWCDRCEQTVRSDNTSYIEDRDEYWCERCCDMHGYFCESCDRLVSDWHDETECGEENNPLIHNYSYKPEALFHEHSKDTSYRPYDYHTPYMGFELEVEIKDGMSVNVAAENVQAALSHRAYLKQDGSIERGFEIVTHPHTLEAYQKDLDWSFIDQLSTDGGISWRTRTCGLHVHVSRRAFTSLVHQALFTYLIQNNEEQMTRLAGRAGSHWAKFHEDGLRVPAKVKGQSYDRYQAVNMTNRETVEIRIFRGSLMKRRILMALELVNACFEYTRLMTSNDYIKGNTSWDAFAKWVRTRKEYENLNYYIRLYRLYDNHTVTTN